jgi:large subunit ribosomal protein L37Ae
MGNTTKRFGARYGRRNKAKLAPIEELQRAKQKCPYCNKTAVKRLAMGIWHCAKCESKFAGKAYTV